MLIKKQNAIKHENSKTCTAWEHNHPTKNLSYATILINGRYPEQKRVTNLESEEIIFVISGSGTIHSEKGDFELNPGDSYHIQIEEKYYIEGDSLLLGITNAPKWTFEQYRNVD
jgi:mannose-6-phosphate isomerase class I